MIILLYQNSLQKNEIVSANVHILEVLNNLSKLGHTVIYANGEYHSIMTSLLTKSTIESYHKNIRWRKTKKIISGLFFRPEALLAFYFFREVKLFFLALITAIHHRPELIYRRNVPFGSDYLLSKIFRIPCVKEVNGIDINELILRYNMNGLMIRIFDWIEKNSLSKADRYIVVTEKLKDILNKEYGVSVDKIDVIENGANTDLFKPIDMSLAKRELKLDLRNNFICFVGGLAIWHGVEYLISAMPTILEEYPIARALIIGEGNTKNTIFSQSLQLGISDKVIFTGRIPYEKVPWYINASDICVIPSIDIGVGISSLKLCEYLACAKPVVASKISGFEFIEKEDCGYLINQESGNELAKAIIRLLRDPLSRQRMGENGRKYVLERRSWESVAKKVAAVCEKTIKEHMKRKA